MSRELEGRLILAYFWLINAGAVLRIKPYRCLEEDIYVLPDSLNRLCSAYKLGLINELPEQHGFTERDPLTL
jgi:hypothetical protein